MYRCAALCIHYVNIFRFINVPMDSNAALLWQKETSDIPSKFELLMFSYFTSCALLPGQILCINTHPAKRC